MGAASRSSLTLRRPRCSTRDARQGWTRRASVCLRGEERRARDEDADVPSGRPRTRRWRVPRGELTRAPPRPRRSVCARGHDPALHFLPLRRRRRVGPSCPIADDLRRRRRRAFPCAARRGRRALSLPFAGLLRRCHLTVTNGEQTRLVASRYKTTTSFDLARRARDTRTGIAFGAVLLGAVVWLMWGHWVALGATTAAIVLAIVIGGARMVRLARARVVRDDSLA